jgi:hypothetical protein
MSRFGSAVLPIFCVLLAISLPPAAWPQASTGMVSGTVRDPTSAVIPNASVTLTNTDTNGISKTTTNGTGFYVFPGIVPGAYALVVEAPGMAKFEGSLVVQVQQSAVVDVTMKLGQTSTQVAIADVTPMVQTDGPALGTVLERQRIEQLPINGRSLTTLLQTAPGQEGTRAFGMRDFSFEMVLDGAALADRYSWNTITSRQPGLDSIQEFRVENNNSSAKYARPTNIVVTTKGGTNSFHGSAFETNRNSGIGVARARQDTFTKPPFLNRNEFGGSGGGPVYIPKLYNGKNKTFWFFSWESSRQLQATTLQYSLPTQQMRNGDLSGLTSADGHAITIYDPWSTDTNTWSRVPFPNNQLPANRASPLYKYLIAVTQLPTLPNVNGFAAPNYVATTGLPWNRSWTTSSRIDQRFSDKDTFYGRYSKGMYTNRSQFYGVPTLDWTKVPGNTQGQIQPNWSFALSEVHTFSPTLFNELLVTGTRTKMNVVTGDPSVTYDTALGLPNPFGVNQWPGLYDLAYNSNMLYETQNGTGFYAFYGIVEDNATKIKGKHELQLGFHFRFDRMNLLPQQQQGAGSDSWNTNATSLYDPTTPRSNPGVVPFTGDQFANFYLGLGNYNNQLNRGLFYARSREYAGYFQDNWRVSSRLTLNLGLRYDLFPPYYEKNNALVSFDRTNHAVILGAPISKLETLGYTFPSIVNRLTDLGVKFESYQQAGLPEHLVNTSHDGLGPRLGFAYKVGDGAKSFVLRGGYRISYFHFVMGGWAARMRQNLPMTARFYWSQTQAAYSPDGLPNYSIRTVPVYISGQNTTGLVQPSDASKSLAAGCCGISYFNTDMPDPRVQDWNITAEKQIMSNTLVRVGYFGNHSGRLEQLYQYNSSTPDYIWYTTTGLQKVTGALANVFSNFYDNTGAYGFIERWQNTGWGNSNGIQLEMERRFSQGIAFQVFYVMDNSFMAGGNGYQTTSQIPEVNQFLPGQVPTDINARDRLLDYQRDISTPKHRVRWNWLADLPVGKGKKLLGNANGFLDRIVGGWQVAGLGSLASTYLTLPATMFPTGTPVQVYGYKYPVQDCTSTSAAATVATCYPGYFWYNGYIPSTLLNSHNANGVPNGYEGIPANYQPAFQPLIPYGQAALPPGAPAGTNVQSFWGTNTVWVTLKDGTEQRTTWAGLQPLRQQYVPSVLQWGLDASLFKTIPVNERFKFRFNADFFNVLNHPGNPNSLGSTGILATRNSGNAARVLQLTLRLSW